MGFIYIFLVVIILLLTINLFVSLKNTSNSVNEKLEELTNSIKNYVSVLKETETNLKNEFVTNRKENADTARGLREEISNQQNKFIQTFSEQLTNLTNTVGEKFISFQNNIDNSSKQSREELNENLDKFKQELNDALKDYRERLREQFGEFEKNQRTQNVASSEKLNEIKSTLEKSLKSLQEGNEKKLDEMRNTVDEKLQKTLEIRLTQSFELVSKNLESVQKGLGEMQSLAVGVGDLKRVLSNVKTRGTLGEIQ